MSEKDLSLIVGSAPHRQTNRWAFNYFSSQSISSSVDSRKQLLYEKDLLD